MKNKFQIATILPLWRWAVCPDGLFSPGIPFWSEYAARKFYNEVVHDLPWVGCFLLQKPWWGKRLSVVEHYRPKSSAQLKGGSHES